MIAAAGAVLAGGHSRRMGRDKALVPVDGRLMVLRVAASMAAAGCDPVVVIGGDTERLQRLGLSVVPDRWPGEGPLGAIITALEHTDMPTVVAACDLPWLDEHTVCDLVDHVPADRDADVVVAVTDRDQPLCACWLPTALPALRHGFDAGERAVHRLLTTVRTVRVQVAPGAVRNVNTPADLPPV